VFCPNRLRDSLVENVPRLGGRGGYLLTSMILTSGKVDCFAQISRFRDSLVENVPRLDLIKEYRNLCLENRG
jgi:hypothetical protein